MARDCYIAVDLGAESGRVIAGSPTSLEVVHRFANRPVRIKDSLFWDIAFIYGQVIEGLRAAFSTYAGRIASIGLDTWGVDYGLLDAQGDLLGLPYMYRDDRTQDAPEQLWKTVPRREVFEHTGVQHMQLNTLYQLFAHRAAKPEVVGAARRFLTIPDLLNYWLTGAMTNEYSITTTTQLYNPRSRDWAWDMLDALAIPRRLFGEIIMPGTIIGPLLSHVAQKIGADSGVVVVAPACHDTACAVAAVPASAGGGSSAYLSSGTWSLLGIESPRPIVTDVSYASNFTNEGSASGEIRFLKNIMGLWIVQECKRSWDEEDQERSYGELANLAEQAAGNRFRIDPDDPRFLKPGVMGDSMPERIREYCRETNQPPPTTPGEAVRGILESLARSYASAVQSIERTTGNAVDVLHIIGGGSQNRLLNQLTATAIGREVHAGPVEATAIGNLLMQAIAAGAIGSIAQGRDQIRQAYEVEIIGP